MSDSKQTSTSSRKDSGKSPPGMGPSQFVSSQAVYAGSSFISS